MTERRFRWWLLAVVLAATAFRLAYVVGAKAGEPPLGDQIYYSAQARVLAKGGGFDDPFRPGEPAADHAPLTAVLLAVPTFPVRQADDVVLVQRLFMALLGGVAVGLVGLLGRAVTGDRRVGLVAAGITAVSANFWMNDGLVMSETPTVVCLAATLLLAYRYARQRTVAWAAGLGLALGVTVLARAELALLAVVLVTPLVLLPGTRTAGAVDASGPGVPWSRRVGHLAVAGVVALATQLPWWALNAQRFAHPVLFSTNEGLTYIGANCDSVFDPAGGIGFWDLQCAYDAGAPPGLDQSELSRFWRDRAFEYIADHRDEVPMVMGARVGRVWGVFRPFDMVWLNQGEGREPWASRLGIWTWWITAPLAAAGAVVLLRRRTLVFPLLVLPVLVTGVAAWFYGIVRFRTPAEVAAAVLAAVALVAVVDRLRPRVTPTDGPGDGDVTVTSSREREHEQVVSRGPAPASAPEAPTTPT